MDEEPDASAAHDADAAPDAKPKSCPPGHVLCAGGTCATVSSDDNSCGACTKNVCSGGQHCVSGSCQASKIEHVVLIVQENHTFDSYFGKYCLAPAYSNPACTTGRACCEAAPATEPGSTSAAPGTLNDDSNFASDREHGKDCELLQIDNGLMDRYVTGTTGGGSCDGKQTTTCSDPINWVVADGALPTDAGYYYWALANGYGALADHYFQPIAGGTASNNMYFAGAHYRFFDNGHLPDVATGRRSGGGLCVDLPSPANCIPNAPIQYPMDTIASLLLDGAPRKSFAVYADGYGDAYSAALAGDCPSNPPTCRYWDCVAHPIACFGCVYDPSDIPFLYYQRFADTPSGGSFIPTPYAKDYEASFQKDINDHTLPNFAFVKARLWHNEHPNMSNVNDGQLFVAQTVNAIYNSPVYKDNTLILLTWDEGGGFFDHVAPPADPPINVDADDTVPVPKTVPYGTRVPFLAIGAFAKTGTVSHVQMEHSSIVKFLEWNFLTRTGQLNARDGWVNNIGSLLDSSKTGIPVPEK